MYNRQKPKALVSEGMNKERWNEFFSKLFNGGEKQVFCWDILATLKKIGITCFIDIFI